MRKLITQAWQTTAAKTLTSGLKTLRSGPYTQKRINTFLAKFGLKLSDPLTKEQLVFVEKRVNEIYAIAKRIGAKEAKFKPVFDLVDKRAVQAISRQQVFWVGDFYTDKLSTRIRAVSNDVLLERGFSHSEAAEELGNVLRQEFGLVDAAKGPTKYAPKIPARYAGRSELYLRQVASTAAHQARTFGRLIAYQQGGIKRLRLTNPNDDRTGKICRQMDGQIVTVAAASTQMNNILAAKSPTQVKAAAPWLTSKGVSDVLGGAKPGSPKATRRLETAGLAGDATMIPPFHGECLAADTQVVTARGLVPIQKVKIGDYVLTHKGRLKRVSSVFKHQVTGSFMEIVVQSSKLGITPNHPILDAGDCFVEANKLETSSRVKTVTQALQILQCCNVCGSIKIPCSILLKGMQSTCKEEEFFRQEARENNTACVSCLCAMWQYLFSEGKQGSSAREREVLHKAMQSKIPGSESQKNLHCLWCNLFSLSVQWGSENVFLWLSKYSHAQREKKIQSFQGEDVRQQESDVCQNSKTSKVDQGANRVQRYNRCQRQTRGNSDQANRQARVEAAIRAKEILFGRGFDLCARSVYSRFGFVDRDRIRLQIEQEAENKAICKSSREFFGYPISQSLLIGSHPVEQIDSHQVTCFPVFNLDVEDDHTYVAGGVVMHNCRTEFVVVD